MIPKTVRPRLKVQFEYHGQNRNVSEELFFNLTADVTFENLQEFIRQHLQIEASMVEEIKKGS